MKATKRSKKRNRVQNAVLFYLARTPFASAASIQKGIGLTKGNIYQTMAQLVQKGDVIRKEGSKLYQISDSAKEAIKVTTAKRIRVSEPDTQRAPLYQAPPPEPNPLANIYLREIEFIQDGIDSLMITKNYLERRIEQLKLEDAKRARTN